jgi:Cd2+/Zn2+-exporting ATPase/Cu+-exporting ATPase
MGVVANHSIPPGGDFAAENHPQAHEEHSERADIVIFLLVGVAAAISWTGVVPRVQGIDAVAVVAVLGGGYPVFREAVQNLLAKRMTMELSMTIALIAALTIREFTTALFILFFVLGAEILEHLTLDQGRKAIRDLLSLMPKIALIKHEGEIVEVPIELVHPGDVVVIRPGAEIPVDGVVLQGHSSVDQSSITGESKPVDKVPGTTVFAGTTNHTGALDVHAERVGRNTVFGKIIEAVEKAEHSRAPVQKLADRLSGWLVYFALAAAILTFAVTQNVRSTIAVVIVAGACGIAAGTPLAVLGAIGRAARGGAIVKGGRYMEALGTIDTVVLDKTGTLTFGEPYVTDIVASPGVDSLEILRVAATAERPSEHPLARAILKEAARLGLTATDPDCFEYIPGKGVCSVWRGAEILVGNASLLSGIPGLGDAIRGFPEDMRDVLVAHRGRLLGAIRTADVLRPQAVEAMARLRSMNLRAILLTGDRGAIAAKVACELGVRHWEAELMPEDKLRRVRELIRDGRRVAMIGDGVNDAPALAEATVGIAMGSGTDLARHSAGVLLLGNDLVDAVELLNTARRCRRIIFFNFVGTLVVDAAGVLLASVGVLTPLMAAIVHVSSEMAFILNSARLVPTSGRQHRPPEVKG